MPAFETEQRARSAAEKAVELDPNLAKAHTSPGFAEFLGISGCGRCRPRLPARELDPNLARAHDWYAAFLISVLRPEDAPAEMERARPLDPSFQAILADKGALLMAAGTRKRL